MGESQFKEHFRNSGVKDLGVFLSIISSTLAYSVTHLLNGRSTGNYPTNFDAFQLNIYRFLGVVKTDNFITKTCLFKYI